MLALSAIKIDSTVSFDLYPAHYLGTSIKNAKVLGVMNAAQAMKMGFDAPAVHAAVKPTLPADAPSNYDQYQYVCLKLASGQETFIGVPWIKDSTYVEEMIRTVAIYIENISPDQQNLATQALSAVGLKVAKVEVIS